MRTAVVSAVLGLALAVGAPTAWVLTRPETAAGVPVEQSLPSPERPSAPTRPATPAPVEAAPAPARITAPALGIDAPVDPVGVAADGQMELPEDVSRVGWYRFGTTPGGAGSAVIAGHVDDAEQGLGALAPIARAEVGDEVTVTDSAGTATRWRVVSREVITKQVLPVERIFARDGAPRLTLVTCGGPFQPELRSYRDNVVVVAEPAP